MPEDGTRRTELLIADMDCPSEEQMIRTALADAETILRLDFDLGQRGLTVWHGGDAAPILARLEALNLGAKLVTSVEAPDAEVSSHAEVDQTRVLRWVLAINATMFVGEFVAGWFAESTGWAGRASTFASSTPPACWPTRSTCWRTLRSTESRCGQSGARAPFNAPPLG